jgi:hypothetical protein
VEAATAGGAGDGFDALVLLVTLRAVAVERAGAAAEGADAIADCCPGFFFAYGLNRGFMASPSSRSSGLVMRVAGPPPSAMVVAVAVDFAREIDQCGTRWFETRFQTSLRTREGLASILEARVRKKGNLEDRRAPRNSNFIAASRFAINYETCGAQSGTLTRSDTRLSAVWHAAAVQTCASHEPITFHHHHHPSAANKSNHGPPRIRLILSLESPSIASSVSAVKQLVALLISTPLLCFAGVR